MKKIGIGIGVIAIIIIAILLGNKQNKDQDVVTIGAISGLTGEYAAVGQNWQKGVRLAHEIHQKDPKNIRVELFEEDSEFNTKKGVSAYNKLKSVHNIDALINADTFTINGIYELVSKEPFPIIQGGEQSIKPIDDNVFQIMPGNIEAEVALGKYVSDNGYKNVGLFFTQEATFGNFAQGFKDGFEGTISEYPLAPDKKTDFRTDIAKALNADHDALVIITVPQQGALLTRELLGTTQSKPQLVYDANFVSGISDYTRILEDISIIDGSIVMTLKQTLTDEFKVAYKERYGEEPGFFSDWGYDAYNLLVNTYDADGEHWIQNVKESQFTGVSGEIEFDETGIRRPQYEVKRIVKGELQ